MEFGEISGLPVSEHQPLWEPFPMCIQTFTLGKGKPLDLLTSQGPRSALTAAERELFAILDRISGTAFLTIAVQDGQPVRVTVQYPDEHWLRVIRDN